MEKTDEKLENIEQVMELLIAQIKSQGKKLSFLVEREEITISTCAEEISPEAGSIPKAEDFENLNYTMEKLTEKINTLPKVFNMKHHHSFETKSKSYTIGAVIIFIVVALSAGASFFLIFRNSELSDESDKFRIIRGNYPDLAKEIDTFYLKDKERIMKDAEVKIIHNQSMLDAETKENKAKKEYEKAKAQKKRLNQKP
ncbi:MAG: hypothetical protein EOO18_08175 [Chryseobacterium sp.]|nr:MAG: hypothetical protein EOO18_08175 [Chryseobacterium sp.]